MVVENGMGTSTSNQRHQNSSQGWDNTEGRKRDQKLDIKNCNQSKEIQSNLVREPFIQVKDGVAAVDKGSGSCLEKQEATSSIKPIAEMKAKESNSNQIVGPDNEGKGLSKGNWKRIAREKGKAQDVDMNAQAH
nr:hypothetical protein CFP56_28288 [Quercus suber]